MKKTILTFLLVLSFSLIFAQDNEDNKPFKQTKLYQEFKKEFQNVFQKEFHDLNDNSLDTMIITSLFTFDEVIPVYTNTYKSVIRFLRDSTIIREVIDEFKCIDWFLNIGEIDGKKCSYFSIVLYNYIRKEEEE